MKGRAHPSPFAAIPFPDSEEVSFTAGLTERAFQTSDGDTLVPFHNLPAYFCTIVEALLSLNHGASLHTVTVGTKISFFPTSFISMNSKICYFCHVFL